MVVYYVLKYVAYLNNLTPYCFRILYTCIMYLVSIANKHISLGGTDPAPGMVALFS